MAKKAKSEEINQALIENFISLQKVLTHLAVKFDNLSENISKLLNLFEISAKSFVERSPIKEDPQKDREFLDKINTLLEQNKTIAKGLTLMEEKIRSRVQPVGNVEMQMPEFPSITKPVENKFKRLPTI